MTEIPGDADPSRAEATRLRLLAAAVQAFANKGFHGTTTRDIAGAAGLSSAGLYVHHRSKEELLYQISLSGHERTLRLIIESKSGTPSPLEQLSRAVRAYTAHHAREPTEARVVNYELAALSPAHYLEMRAIREQISDEILQIVEAGVAEGTFDTVNPHMATVAVLSLGIDVARWYREGGSWTPEDVGDFYVGLALRMVGCSTG